MVFPDWVLNIEFKLTGSAYGKAQCEGLYAPLLSLLYDRPVRILQICKNLTSETPGPFQTLDEFLTSTDPYATWHWVR